jgi:oligopeptide/dipeptide ABC transporter ATP-binding protein
MAMIYITHDLHVAAGFCDRIAVIYAGEVVEMAAAPEIMANPQHPYTKGLVGSLPETHWRERMVDSIRGQPPILGAQLAYCPFAPRCPEVIDRCRQIHPTLTSLGPRRLVRCVRRQEGEASHGAG